MRTVKEPAREVPVVREVDVLVVGGGPAGFCAAAAAARMDVSVLLVERYGYLGGLATGGLVLFMDALSDGEGTRVIGGLAWETLELLRGMGALAADGPLDLHVDSEWLKIVADDLCIDSGAELLLHSWAVNAIVEEGRVRGVIVESKSGREAILCRVCIDATGDGDIAAFAGASHDVGNQCIGLNLKVGGVDAARFLAFEREHSEEARALRAEIRSMGGCAFHPGSTPQSEQGVFWLNTLGLAGHDMDGDHDTKDVIQRFRGQLSAVNVDDLTYVEVEMRRRLALSLEFAQRRVPGFEGVHLLSIASQVGVRDSRRVHALHKLTRDEALREQAYADTVGYVGLTLGTGGRFAVPYRSLVPQDLEGLLTSGRCIHCDDWVQHRARLIPPAMMTGQAAGTAAALAILNGVPLRELDLEILRDQLADDDVIL